MLSSIGTKLGRGKKYNKSVSTKKTTKRTYAVKPTVKAIDLKQYKVLGTVPYEMTAEGIKYNDQIQALNDFTLFSKMNYKGGSSLTDQAFEAKVYTLASLEALSAILSSPEKEEALKKIAPTDKQKTAAKAAATAWIAKANPSVLSREITLAQLLFSSQAQGLRVNFQLTRSVESWFLLVTQVKDLLKNNQLAAVFTGAKTTAEGEAVFSKVFLRDVITRVCNSQGINADRVNLISNVNVLRAKGVLPPVFKTEFPVEMKRVAALLEAAASLHVNAINIADIVHCLVQARDALHRAEKRLSYGAFEKKKQDSTSLLDGSFQTVFSASSPADAQAALTAMVNAEKTLNTPAYANIGVDVFPEEASIINKHLESLKKVHEAIPTELLAAEIARRKENYSELAIPESYEITWSQAPYPLWGSKSKF